MVGRDLSPSIEPVYISRVAGHTAPSCYYRNQVEFIVCRKELWGRVVQGIPGQAFSKTCRRYESLSVGTPTNVEFIYQARIEGVYTVGRSAIVRVKVVRANSPPIDAVGSVGPSGGRRSLIIRCPPLRLEVNAVIGSRRQVDTKKIAVLGHVDTTLKNVLSRVTRSRGIRQRIVVEQILRALVNPASGNDIARELHTSERIENYGRNAARILRLRKV